MSKLDSSRELEQLNSKLRLAGPALASDIARTVGELLAQEYSKGRRDFIEQLLLDERGNEAAGHKWSRADFMKYLQEGLENG